jgi:TPR repeat protein
MIYLRFNHHLLAKLSILVITGIVLSVFILPDSNAAEQDQIDNTILIENTMMKKLFELHTKLAKQGNLESIVKLGAMYEKGEGVAKDRNKAIILYKQAADKGYKPAKQLLANILSNKPNDNKRTNIIKSIKKVPARKNNAAKQKAETQRQKELQRKLERERAAAAAARAELERLRQQKLEEQEKQQHLQAEVEKIEQAKEALAQERAKAEEARLELERVRKQHEEQLRKQQEQLKKQQELAKKQQEQNLKEQGGKQAVQDQPEADTTFSSDPCNTPAAKFMSTCN